MKAKVWITYGPQRETGFAAFAGAVRAAGKFADTMIGFGIVASADDLIQSDDDGYVEMVADVEDGRLERVLRALLAQGLTGLTVDYRSEEQADLIERLGFQCGDDLSAEGV